MKTKVELSKGIIFQPNGKYSWRLYVFEPKKQFSICTVSPGFIQEFETKRKCIKNMNEVCKKLGL